jgi:hypothetical protein
LLCRQKADVVGTRRSAKGPQKYSNQLISVSFSNSENDQKRNEFGTAWLPDYSACGHTSLSIEFAPFGAAAMQFLSEPERCGEPAF